MQVIEDRSDTPSPYTRDGDHHLGRSHQAIHFNSVKNNTKVNLDAAMLDSKSGEEHNMPSQYSRLILECENLRI